MKGQTKVEKWNHPDMARARALIKAVGYDTDDLRRRGRGEEHLIRTVADAYAIFSLTGFERPG
jgi:hypothetical protein